MYKIDKWRIEVKDLHYSKNNLPDGKFKLDPRIFRNTGMLDETHYYTQISVIISSSKETQFPFDLRVVLRAVFEVEANGDNDGIEDFLRKQAVHVLYPYVRSTVTGLTQVAMMPPIVLPLINAFKFFNDTEGDSNKK